MRHIPCTAGALLSLALLLSGCSDEPVTTTRIPKEERPVPSMPMPGAQSAQGAAPAAAPAGQPGAGAQPSMGMTALPGMAEQAAAFATPAWSVPADWEAQPLGTMRKGSWKVPGPDGTSAEVSVLVFPGDVGGDLANVNRWAGQVGLPPMSEAQLASERQAHAFTTAGGDTGFYVHFDGPAGQSITGAIVPHAGASWFFKLMGDTALVQAQTPAFLDFVRSVRFPAS
ncbi:MAG: hypothetical protein Q7Q73_04120 [Verrucomicrobiota bacterium JB024]|nr:hypothetical protein [Verrucomicrobiota bacterium JB024]